MKENFFFYYYPTVAVAATTTVVVAASCFLWLQVEIIRLPNQQPLTYTCEEIGIKFIVWPDTGLSRPRCLLNDLNAGVLLVMNECQVRC